MINFEVAESKVFNFTIFALEISYLRKLELSIGAGFQKL
jgi:hypothetical protein